MPEGFVQGHYELNGQRLIIGIGARAVVFHLIGNLDQLEAIGTKTGACLYGLRPARCRSCREAVTNCRKPSRTQYLLYFAVTR